jgi:hypothetical protein
MSLHPEILNPQQRKTLRLLGPEVTARSFYLGGGTALAIQLGHRRSIDFDWFLEGPLGTPGTSFAAAAGHVCRRAYALILLERLAPSLHVFR